MPSPHDTLSIFAEVSIALAGFSVIAIAFSKRPIQSLTNLEVRRFTNLFVLSGAALIFSLTGASLLHVEPADPCSLWRWGSGVAALFGSLWLARDVYIILHFDPIERAALSMPLVVGFDLLYAVIILLQVANALSLGQPWPFFIMLVVLVIAAFQQFILLVWDGLGRGKGTDAAIEQRNN